MNFSTATEDPPPQAMANFQYQQGSGPSLGF